MNTMDINALLIQWDGYICRVARHYVQQYKQPSTEMDLEDLAQQARIKLWIALEEREITNLKVYIRRIVQSEVVDMIRRRHDTLPLLLNEEGELSRSSSLTSTSEDFQDPASLVERAETIHDYLEMTAAMVCTLPPCQKYVMLCTLKDHVDDLLLLKMVFREQHLEIKDVHWPQETVQCGRLRASLWVSRKKLRAKLQSMRELSPLL